jgi:hypothetical protein
MPPASGQTTARSRRAVRRRKPEPQAARAVRNARAQQSAYVSQGRAVQRTATRQRRVAAARPRPTPRQQAAARRSLGFQPGRTGIEASQRQARVRSDRAQRRAPAPPVPHIPIIRNPSHAQTIAAHQQIAAAINRTAQQRHQPRAEVVRQVETDPRLAHFKRASYHYARAGERQQADVAAKVSMRGKTATVPIFDNVPGGPGRIVGYRRVPLQSLTTRSDRIRVGRALVAANRLRNPAARAGTPARRVGVGPATVSVPGLQRALAAGTSLDVGDVGPRRFAGRAGADVKSLATGPFVGGYELAAGTYQAATGGGTGRLQRLGKGVAQSTYDTFRHPIRSFEEHPLLTPLTFAAGVGAAGRIGGAVARGAGSTAEAAGARGALARAGSTVRPPLAFSEDAGAGGVVQRTYSKDLSRKAVQVMQDRAREPLRREDGTVVTVRQRGREVPVLKATVRERERMGKSQGNFLAGRANAAERAARDEAGDTFAVTGATRAKWHNAVAKVTRREADRLGIKGRAAQDLVGMVVDGTITSTKHFEEDLTLYRNMVEREVNRHTVLGQKIFHDSRQLKDAQATVHRIDRLLADKRVLAQKDRIVAAGEQLGRKLNEHEAEAIRLGVLNKGRAQRARLIHPAVLHMGARHFTPEELTQAELPALSEKALKHGALRAPDGQFISNRGIQETLRAKGRDPDTVAYLPPEALGRRAFHARFNLARPTIGGDRTRTGEQFRRGLTSTDANAVREQGTRLTVQTEKARAIDRAVTEHGLKHPSGRHFTAQEAAEYAKRLERETGERLTAVRAFPAKATAEMQRLARAQQDPAAMENLGQRLLNDRLNVKPGTKNVVLMPSSLVERLADHAAPTPALLKPFQMLNRAFRAAVLPQPRWLTGNFAEPYVVRLTAAGSGLNVFGLARDLDATAKILKSMGRQEGELRAAGKTAEADRFAQALKEIKAQQVGTGLFVGQRGASVHRELEEMPGAKTWGPVIAKTPAVREMVEMTRLLGRGLMAPANIFFRANRIIEQGAQRAAFGRSATRDIQELSGSWIKAQRLAKDAVDEAARGLVDTPAQRRFMEAQYELLGKYQGFSPTMRAFTQTIAPFLPWMLNAGRFVFWTMPAHNTVKAAFLQRINDVTQKDWQDIHQDVPPGSLRYAIPNGKGGWIDLARYTPYGAFTETAGGGGYRTFTSQILPQIGGPQAALEGEDPFGRELRAPKTAENPTGKANEVAVAANSLVEGLVPYVAQARRLREGGGTSYPTSTLLDPQVKPGTTGQMGALRRTFDPLRPTYVRPPTGGASSRGEPTGAAARAVRRAQRHASRGASDASVERALRRARRAAGGG